MEAHNSALILKSMIRSFILSILLVGSNVSTALAQAPLDPEGGNREHCVGAGTVGS